MFLDPGRAVLLALVTLLPATPAAGDPVVAIVRPRSGEPVFGQVEVRASVESPSPVLRLTFRVDGRVIAALTSPPWVVFADLGGDNVSHSFEVEAEAADGTVGRAAFTSPKLPTDEEILVDLKQLFVTVTRDGATALDLGRESFTVIEDGVEQEIATFARGDVAVSVVLLVDASRSMRGRPLQIALQGVRSFVAQMAPEDDASVLLFSDELLWETPFARDPDLLLEPLAKASARGGTALHDMLYVGLKRLEPLRRRTVVIVLSDGVDVDSVLGAEDVRWAARKSSSQLFWIRSREPLVGRLLRSSSWRGQQEHDLERASLEAMVVESGGRVVVVPGVDGVAAALAEILRELREQYVLGYDPGRAGGDARWHSVEVVVEGATARTREGYLGE